MPQSRLQLQPKALPSIAIPSLDQKKLIRKKAASCPEMTEKQIIAKAQAGDMACFEILYHRYNRRIFSLCLRMSGNYARAEDFTQEAFLQLHRKIATFRGESAFSTWLHRLTVNIILMHFRKRGIQESSLDEILNPEQEDAPVREFGRRDDSLHDSADRITMERALSNLSPGYRCVFVLHDVEGYEHNEIAEMLGCSIGNSKSQLHKARMKLRTMLPRKSAKPSRAAELLARRNSVKPICAAELLAA